MVSATIFGSGNMGGAISDLLSGAGASVQHVEEGENATIADELVVLAVPYEALRDIVEKYGDQLRDRVVVDITNPVDFESFDALKVPAHSTAAAELAAALPGARGEGLQHQLSGHFEREAGWSQPDDRASRR